MGSLPQLIFKDDIVAGSMVSEGQKWTRRGCSTGKWNGTPRFVVGMLGGQVESEGGVADCLVS